MDQISQRLDRIIALLEKQTEPVREILTLEEAASYLRMSPHTVREKVRMRQIPFFRVGGAIRFRRSKLDRWIDRSEVSVAE